MTVAAPCLTWTFSATGDVAAASERKGAEVPRQEALDRHGPRLLGTMTAPPTTRPLSKRQRRELHGYIAWSTQLGRAVMFVGAVAAAGALLRAVHAPLAARFRPLDDDLWWIVPTLLLASALFYRSRRWTGGAAFRKLVRMDLDGGVTHAESFSVLDVIEVEEEEDEGPGFVLRLADGRTMLMAGQYLEPYKRRGFPWSAFEIEMAPHSGTLFRLRRTGDRISPSSTRQPFSWSELKSFGDMNAHYWFLDEDFESLRTPRGDR